MVNITVLVERLFSSGTKAAVLVCALIQLALSPDALACDSPRYRFFLEVWPADIYDVYVFHDGRGGEDFADAMDYLRDVEAAPYSNFRVVEIDPGDFLPENFEAYWSVARGRGMPLLAASYPGRPGGAGIFFSAPMTRENVEKLVDSPARREVAELLSGGSAAVWVFLESGDMEADAAALEALEKQLPELREKYLQGVRGYFDPMFVKDKGIDIDFDFPVVSVSRTDPAEEALVEMLLGSETGLRDAAEPLVFPVFGRGRALYALAGGGIAREWIDEAAAYILQKCDQERCEDKKTNLGTDLMISHDWTADLGESWIDESEHFTSISAAIELYGDMKDYERREAEEYRDGQGAADAGPGADTAGDAEMELAAGAVSRNTAIVAGIVLMTVAAASFFLLRKKV